VKKKTLIGVLFSVVFPVLEAAEPTLDAFWPPGAKAGTTVEFITTGKVDPWPCQFHCTDPSVKIVPDSKKKGTGQVTIKNGAKPGPVLIRAFNDEGASDPVIFTISNQTEILEDEKDESTVSKAQAIPADKIPCVINGKLAKSDEVDSYRISLKKGQTLYASLEGYALRSPVDPALHLYDPRGVRVAIAHDNAVNLDPQMTFPVSENGDFTLSVMAFSHPASASVGFIGSSKAVYRVHVATDRKKLPSRLLPNSLGADTNTLKFPGHVDGTLSKTGEMDAFTFVAKKGQSIFIEAGAFQFRYPTDPVLFLRKPDGSLIKQIDDTKPTRDAAYLWKVPADGNYQIQVTDRFRRGGSDFRYRLSAAPPEVSFSATIEKNRYSLLHGKSLDLKIKLTRENGHASDLKIRASGLPAGVTLEEPKAIPKKTGDFVVKLKVASGSKKASVPFRLYLKEKDGKKPVEKPVLFSFQSSTARGPYLIDETPDVWLTVLNPPKKAAAKKAAAKKEKKK